MIKRLVSFPHASKFIRPSIGKWKSQLIEHSTELFEAGRRKKPSGEPETDQLYQQIGRLQVELEWLKKNLPSSVKSLRSMIDPFDSELSVFRQCQLVGLSPSSYYYPPIPVSCEELDLMKRFEQFHFEHPYFGSRPMAMNLFMSRSQARCLMRDLPIVATYPHPKTTIPNQAHKKYPYLLRDIMPSYPNHIGSTDITYISLEQGFMYLVAIIDWYSRMILSWRLSNTMDVIFCAECLQAAFDQFGEPEYSTVIKVFSLRLRSFNNYSRVIRRKSVWMARDVGWTMFLLNDFGER
jgi:putative transposase